MNDIRRWFVAAAGIAMSAGLAGGQVGTITGAGNPTLACTASVQAPAQLRQEGYTELLGDILITCTGGSTLPLQPPTAVPTTDITVNLLKSNYVPITSRIIGSTPASSAVSEALLIIDDAGSSLPTGATGGYGPQAPQSLCTTAQQQNSACTANVALDQSGQYQVAVRPGTSTPAQNVYQGAVGDSGPNSVTFYNVPVLPPVYQGVSRTFRITNIRIPAVGLINQSIFVLPIPSATLTMPLALSAIMAGTVNNPMTASVNAGPAGGQSPFGTCQPPAGAALAAQITFTEGFAAMFKTRVAPLSNSAWAATTPNTGIPGQNVPGSVYGGFGPNSESGFILPAATGLVSGVTYTAGLTDFGTRLKAVFTNIPTGLTLYVSTTNAGANGVPGGNGTAPYAVLAASSQNNEANSDGSALTPLSSGTVTGSDGLTAYPLIPDGTGTAAAIWEVVNANPSAIDALTFSIYIAFNATPQITGQAPANNVALSFAPEPGGGTFSQSNAETGLSSPVPRFAVPSVQQGPWVTIGSCTLNVNTATLPFNFALGGVTPPAKTRSVTAIPTNLAVTVTPQVTTPSGGTWLSASYSSGILTVSVNPSGLAASGTAYTGNVLLGSTAGGSVSVPVSLTVSPQGTGPTCGVTGNGTATVADVQLEINEALGTAAAANGLNEDGAVNVVDVQIVMNAVLALGCPAY